MRAPSYLRLSDLQVYLKKQYNIVFYLLQSSYKLLKKAGITWKKTQKINPAQNE
jgi:putative transposase